MGLNIDLKNKVNQLAQADRNDEAIELCNRALIENADDHIAFSSLAYLYKRTGHIEDAHKAITKAISMDSDQPAYYFDRGRINLDLGSFADAEKDFAEMINFEIRNQREYYLETGYFFRALARFYLKKYKELIEDCMHVSDDFTGYALGAIRTKKDLIASARANLGMRG